MPPGHLYSAQTLGPRLLLWAKVEETAPPHFSCGLRRGIWFRSYLNDLVVSLTFFNLSLNLATRGSWSEPQSAPSLVFADYIELLQMTPPIWQKSEEQLKSLLMKVKEENEKVGLKLNIKKTKIMASGPITSWEIDGETVESVADFIFQGSKITADGDCSHEIKRRLLLGKKLWRNILKSRDITLLTKVGVVKAMIFPVVTYGWESWTLKKAEHQRIDAFELWCWRRLLRVPWTARRSNQSILKEINPEYSLEGLMLKLKLLPTWFKEPTHWKRS